MIFMRFVQAVKCLKTERRREEHMKAFMHAFNRSTKSTVIHFLTKKATKIAYKKNIDPNSNVPLKNCTYVLFAG